MFLHADVENFRYVRCRLWNDFVNIFLEDLLATGAVQSTHYSKIDKYRGQKLCPLFPCVRDFHHV